MAVPFLLTSHLCPKLNHDLEQTAGMSKQSRLHLNLTKQKRFSETRTLYSMTKRLLPYGIKSLYKWTSILETSVHENLTLIHLRVKTIFRSHPLIVIFHPRENRKYNRIYITPISSLQLSCYLKLKISWLLGKKKLAI